MGDPADSTGNEHFLSTWILYLFGPKVPWTFNCLSSFLFASALLNRMPLIGDFRKRSFFFYQPKVAFLPVV